MYIARNMAVTIIMAKDTLAKPYFLMVRFSFCSKGSIPNMVPIRVFLMNATGIRARAFIPRHPSTKKSTAKPVARAMIMAGKVLTLVGMHNTIAGRMVSIARGVKWK